MNSFEIAVPAVKASQGLGHFHRLIQRPSSLVWHSGIGEVRGEAARHNKQSRQRYRGEKSSSVASSAVGSPLRRGRGVRTAPLTFVGSANEGGDDLASPIPPHCHYFSPTLHIV